MRLQEMSSMGIGNKPCLDIRPSADQISDRSISITQLNKSKCPSTEIIGLLFFPQMTLTTLDFRSPVCLIQVYGLLLVAQKQVERQIIRFTVV